MSEENTPNEKLQNQLVGSNFGATVEGGETQLPTERRCKLIVVKEAPFTFTAKIADKGAEIPTEADQDISESFAIIDGNILYIDWLPEFDNIVVTAGKAYFCFA